MKQSGFFTIVWFLLAASVFGQSTNESFPTPINASEISGAIEPRDIGDARLTQHFYTFFADNGDVELKIETANFDGDIDVFEAKTLRPLLKVTVYNGAADNQTRTVYFRKRAQVVLRVEGRTLQDAAARYRISFAGSFAAAADLPQPPADFVPKVAAKPSQNPVARVNSAGAIIEVLPVKKPAETINSELAKSQPNVETPIAAAPARARAVRSNKRLNRRSPNAERQTAANQKAENRNANENAEIKNDNKSTENSNVESNEKSNATANANEPADAAPRRARTRRRAENANAQRRTSQRAEITPAANSPQPDPLINLRLVVLLKNNERVERSMADVFRVTVDKGQLTVITKNGKIERYNLLEVARFAIE